MEFADFIKEIKKVTGHRVHKINKCYGAEEAHRWYMKHQHKHKLKHLDSSLYYYIIRLVNKKFEEKLLVGESVTLPFRMGSLQVVKAKIEVRIKDGKLIIPLGINWNETMRLWFEDEEAKRDKILVRHENRYVYTVNYRKHNANYVNLCFYKFNPMRGFKKRLIHNIREGLIDAFLKYRVIKNG